MNKQTKSKNVPIVWYWLGLISLIATMIRGATFLIGLAL